MVFLPHDDLHLRCSAQLRRELIDRTGCLWQNFGSRGEEGGDAAGVTSMGGGQGLPYASHGQL